MSLLPFQFSAKNLINENKTTQLTIDTVKKWLDTASLPQLQEEFIVLFLLACDNDIKAAKKTIAAYFRVKNKTPEIFNGLNVNDKNVEKIVKVLGCCISPTRMDNNTAVCFFKLIDTNYRNYDMIAALRYSTMILHLCQMYNPPNELVIVMDLKGTGFMHLTCLKFGAALAYLDYIQEAIPIRIKYFHILNSNYVFDKLLSLFKMFITSELMDRIKMFPPGMKMEEFHENWVPTECLPQEYGGSLPTFDEMTKKTIEEVRKNQSFFEAEERLRNLS